MKKLVLFTTILLLSLSTVCGSAFADFEIIQPEEDAYYLSSTQMLLSTDNVSQDVYADIKWYYNNKKVEPVGGNYIINLDSINAGKTESAVIKAVYEGETKKVKIKVYNESVIQKAVNYLVGIQSTDGSFGNYTAHYYIAAALGGAGVDINVPEQEKTTYIEYLSSLDIDEQSTAGELAKLVFSLALMKKNPEDFCGENVVTLLLNKQNDDGTFGEGVYTDVLAIIALDKAGIEIPRKSELISYFEGLHYNNGLFEDWGFIDIDTTARIVRSLKILGCSSQHPIIKQAIQSINELQTVSGAIEAWGEPNCDTSAEVVMMLLDLNINPTEGIWNRSGKNLITAILNNQNEDGSFKSGFDIKYSTYEELSALTSYYFKYHSPLSGGSNGSGGSSGSDTGNQKLGSITIKVSVIGTEGSEIYPMNRVTIDENAKYGKTVLQALYQTGLDFKTKNDDSYISEISGIKEELTSTAGWKYKVNGKVPGVSAKNCNIQNEDEVIWFWAENAEPDSSSQMEQTEEKITVPVMLQKQEQSISTSVYSFSDVSEEHFAWAKKEIDYLASKGLIQGIETGKFEPERELTREEAVKILVLAIGEKSETLAEVKFKDQHEVSSWAAQYISIAKKISIIKGCEGNNFKPKEKITRQELVTMIVRALSYKKLKLETKTKVQFSDWNMVSEWAKESISQAVNAGIVKGKRNGQFAGGDVCTRAEAAVMIYRMIHLFASL